MKLNPPLHPQLRHPLTGQPLRAVYVDKHGTARWPIMGAAPDDPPQDDSPKDDPPKDPPRDDPPRNAPPKDPNDLGFPEDTPVAEMTWEQQAAYHRHHHRKHEDRNKALRGLLGDYITDTGAVDEERVREDLTELAEVRKKGRTDAENAVEDARKEEREKAQREYGTRLVAAEFKAALKSLEGADERDGTDKRDRIIAGLNMADYLTDSGDVDTDKVKSYAADIAPTGTGTGKNGRWPDTGQGTRDGSKPSGVSAGKELFAESRKQ